MVQAKRAFQFPVVLLDPPSQLAQADQFHDRGAIGEVGGPVPDRCRPLLPRRQMRSTHARCPAAKAKRLREVGLSR